ncbi:MAG: hypothetical protein E6R13_03240 [Spirochaetes bacterium]|nr:MAG: hypothetical protein E6R13_03240 [Spirochaetota bacterium]
MPLNFLNPVKQEYVSEYIPAPIKEIADTGEVLQNRYDVVTDKFDKLRALAKNKRSLAGDKSVVDNAIGKIEEQFKTYSKSGNFEDADFVVNQLATDFITDKELQDAEMSYKGYQDALAKQQELNFKGNKGYFFNNIDPASYNTGKQGIYRGDVQERLAHEDEMKKVMGVIGEDSREGQIKYITNLDVPVEIKKAFLQAVTTAGVSKDKIDAVGKAMLPVYLQSNSGKQLYRALKEGQEEFLTGAKTAEEEIYNRLKQSAYNQQSSKLARQFVSAPTKSGDDGWDPNKEGTYKPSSTNVGEGSSSEPDIDNLVVNVFGGDKKSKRNLFTTLDYMSRTAASPKTRTAATELKQLVNKTEELIKKYPQYTHQLRDIATSGNIFVDFGQDVAAFTESWKNVFRGTSPTPAVEKEISNLKLSYDRIINKGLFDSEFEDEFQKAVKTSGSTREIPLVAPSLGSSKVKEAIGVLEHNLTAGDFEVVEGDSEVNPNSEVKILKHSTGAYGAGTGIVYQLRTKDAKNKDVVVLASPKFDRIGDNNITAQFERIHGPRLGFADAFRDVTPMSKAGDRKSVALFKEEIDSTLWVKYQVTVPQKYDDYKIQLNDNGSYSLMTPSGIVEPFISSDKKSREQFSSPEEIFFYLAE